MHFAPLDNKGHLGCGNAIEAKIFVYELLLRTTDANWVSTRPRNPDRANIHLVETGCDPNVHLHSVDIVAETRGPFNGLRFTVGVPPLLNHSDPTLAAAPLNRADMFWVWQQGYKFMSIEAGDEAVLHLGSTGCVSPAPVRPPTAPCDQPNQLRVIIEGFDPTRDVMGLALTDLLEPLADGERCTGNYQAQESCRRVLGSLELDLETGRCGPTCAQTLFHRVRR